LGERFADDAEIVVADVGLGAWEFRIGQREQDVGEQFAPDAFRRRMKWTR